jgi:thiol-disulfide isomerase/thioredoxin
MKKNREGRTTKISATFCAVVVTGVLIGGTPGKEAKPADLALKDLEGKQVRLRDYRGKVVLLNFWATWCDPCRAEMPMLVAYEKEYKDRGVVFIGAALDERKGIAGIPTFLKKYEISFPVWTGASLDDIDRLKMGGAVPATAFVDQNGVIAARIAGQLRENEVRERLDWLLGDRSGPAPRPFVSHVE